MKQFLLSVVSLFVFATCAQAELPSASEAAIKQALSSGQPTVVDLGARSCIPCKKMAPILEELAATYGGKANILFIDVHEDRQAASRFGIQMIPTQIFFDAQGKELKRHVGFMDRAGIVKELQSAGLK